MHALVHQSIDKDPIAEKLLEYEESKEENKIKIIIEYDIIGMDFILKQQLIFLTS